MRVFTAFLTTTAYLALAASSGEVDAIFAPHAGPKRPGFAVLVRKDGRTVLERGYGVRDLRAFAAMPHGGQLELFVNCLRDNPMTQFSIRWILSLNRLSQKSGQVQNQALSDHQLLSEAEMKPALTAVRLADGSETSWPATPGGDNLNPGKPVAYGFGWFLDRHDGRTRMWHSGSTRGFSTAIERFQAEKLTVVVLANRTDREASQLALRVADLFRYGPC